jgi:hypothetical protein
VNKWKQREKRGEGSDNVMKDAEQPQMFFVVATLYHLTRKT